MQQFGDPKRVILCVRWYDSQPPKISGCPDTLTLNAKLFQTARKPTKVGFKTQAGRRCPNVVRQFDITSEPIPSENEAHCGILSSTDVQTRGYVNQLRAILVRLASRRGGRYDMSILSTRSSQRCRSTQGTERRFSSATSDSDISPMKRLEPTNLEATANGRSFAASILLAKSRIASIDRSIANTSPDTAVGLGEKLQSGADLWKTAARQRTRKTQARAAHTLI